MTDAELIARLRGACYLAFDDWCLSTAPEAADRIEQLVATNEALGKACTEWAEVSQSNYQRAKTSEANLTKAVEALENLADCVDLGCFCSEMQMATAMDIARATLAEIKGGNDAKSDL